MPIGAGIAPCGTSIVGFGSVDVGTAPPTTFYVDPATGKVLDAALIDPVSRDYVFDVYGNAAGMRGVYQLVQLAAQTVKNSSAVPGFGNDTTNIKLLDQRTQRRIEDALRDALDAIVQARLIEIIGVTVTRFSTSGMRPVLQFKDLTVGQEQALTL